MQFWSRWRTTLGFNLQPYYCHQNHWFTLDSNCPDTKQLCNINKSQVYKSSAQSVCRAAVLNQFFYTDAAHIDCPLRLSLSFHTFLSHPSLQLENQPQVYIGHFSYHPFTAYQSYYNQNEARGRRHVRSLFGEASGLPCLYWKILHWGSEGKYELCSRQGFLS